MDKTRMGKRAASLLLSLVMMLSLLPTAAYAAMADGVETQGAIVSENGTGVSDDSNSSGNTDDLQVEDSEGSGNTGDQQVGGSSGGGTADDTTGAEGGADPTDSVNGNDSADPQDDGDAVLPAAANVAKVGDTEYATLEAAIAALSSSSYTLELLDETAWDLATPVYWAAGSESGYAATLADALTAAYMANAGGITIVCRPGEDVGKLTHGHVADDITIYGNNAYISSGECDLEVDTYTFSRDTGKQVTSGGAYLEKDITITAYELDNLGVWGERHTSHKVTVDLTDCDSTDGITVQRVYISGTTGVNDITLTGCDFGTKATSVYSNADGAVVIDNCSFTGAQVPVNFNYKANGTQTVAVQNSTFTNCGDNGDWKQFAAPVRFVNSGSGTMNTTVGTCTFTDTVGSNGDILLGDGREGQKSNDVALTVESTEATVQAQQPGYYGKDGTTDASKQGTRNVAAGDKLTTSVTQLMPSDTTTYVAEVNGVKYETLQAAIDAAAKNATVTLLADTRENVTVSKNAIVLDLNGHTLNGGTENAKPALTVDNKKVTLKDSSEAQTGTIKREDTADTKTSHYVIDIQGKNGFMIVESGKVENNSGIPGVKGSSLIRLGNDSVSGWPTLTIKGGTFTQDNFIAIKVDRGTLHLLGGTVNSANSFAIENWNNAYIKGGTVNGTVSTWVYSTGAAFSKLEISGGTVNGNVASVNYDNAADKQARVYVTGGTVTGTLGTYTYNNGLVAMDETAKATIEVTGGTFSKDPTQYVVEDSAISKNDDGTYGVAKTYLAKIGDTEYYTMDEAFHAVKAGETIVMLRDYTTNKVQNSGDESFTIDLGGHTWTANIVDTASAAFEINYSDVTLTVKNGKVVSSQLAGLIPSAMSGTITYNNSKLVFDGVEMTANGHSGIETNGSNTNDTVTLKNSTLNVPNGYGIYFPSSGTLTIDNSVINAQTMGVQVCAGSLNISGAETAITVSGDGIPKTINDGAIEDGAAISIVNRTGYKGLSEITVEDGKFTAKGTNAAVKAYNWENLTPSAFTQGEMVSVSGGTFSSAVDKSLCADGFIPTQNADGTYGVKEETRGTEARPYTLAELGVMTRAEYVAAQEALGGTMYVAVGNYTYDKNGVLGNGERNDTPGQNPDHSKLNAYGENGYLNEKNDGANGKNIVFVNGSITSGATGYTSIDNIGTSLLLAVPAYTNVTFKGITFNNVMSFNYQLYTSPWSQLGELKFDSCTFNGIIVGAIAAQTLTFNGCTFTNYTNTTKANSSNPTWIRPAYGNWTAGDNKGQGDNFRSLTKINFTGNTVTSTRPVKFEYISQWDIRSTVTVTNNSFDISAQKGDTEIKNVGLYLGAHTKTNAFDLVADGNTKSDNTAALYTIPEGETSLPLGSTVTNTNGDQIELADALKWKAADAEQDKIVLKTVKAVASVDTVNFATLAEAIDAAQDGQTVRLLADATEDVVISKSITLDLGGKTLTNTNAGKATISVTGGTVTVQNGSVIGGTSYYNIEVTKNSNANLTLTDVNATAGNTGSSMIDNYGTLTITSGTYTGGLNVVKSEEGSKLTITGGTFTLNYATNGYTGVIFAYGDTTISGGEFIQNLTTTGRWNHPTVILTGVVEGYTAITRVTGGHFVNKISGESIFRGVGKATSDNFEVSGGTFNKSIPDGYCADGFIPTKNTDGTYGVKEGQYVAEIGSKKYETLADAIRLATKGKTITLLADVEQNTQLAIDKSITLDLNGKTIKKTVDIWGDTANAILSITNGAKVTITGNGTIDAKENDCYTINVVKGDLTIENGTFYGNVSVVQVEEGTLSVKGGTFDLHQKWEGSSKYLFNCIDSEFTSGNAKVAISGGTFVGFDPNVSPEQKVDGKTPSFAAPGVGITRNENGSFTAAAGMTAQILDKDGNSVKAYNTLAEAVAAAEDGQTVRLLADVTESNIKVNANITIDLNKMTVTGSFVTYGEVTIQNGTIDVPDGETNYAYGKLTLADVDITGKAASSSLLSVNYNGSVTIDKDSTIVADSAKGDYPAVFIKGQNDSGKTYAPELNIYGTVQSAKTPAIQGNGTDRGVSHVNVFEGAVVKSESLAVYLPQPCEVNITGGLVEGYCGIGIKSGTLNISGGTVRGVANNNVIGDEYSQTNGISYDGSAIMIDSYIGYAGQVQINISGNAVVESKYSTAIREIGNDKSQTNLVGLDITGGTVLGAKDTDAVLVRDVTAKDVNISGGEFSSIVKKEYCAPGFTPVTTANSEGRYGVEIGMFTVMVTSRTTGSNSPVANVAGGGSNITYAVGTTVTASAISGYKFVGWFVNEYTGTPYSTDLTCEVKPTADCTMIAVYEPISGGKFWLTVTASEFTVNGGAVQDSYLYEQFAIGTSVTVEFTGSENFLYWVNESGKVVSTSKTYTFSMGSATTLKAVYAEKEEHQAMVVFISHTQQVISSKGYTDTQEIQFPEPPIKMGATFVRWSMTEAEIRAAMATTTTGIIVVEPVYEFSAGSYTVTVNYPNDETATYTATVGKITTVTAKSIDGKVFKCWKNGDTVLGYTETLKIAPRGDLTLTAEYVDAGTTVDRLPVIALTEISASQQGAKYAVSFTATRSVPDGYTVTEQGILVSTNSRYGQSDALDAMKLDANGAKPDDTFILKATNTDATGVTVLNGTVSAADRTVYGRAYMILRDSSGAMVYVYSDTILSGSYNSLTTNGGN